MAVFRGVNKISHVGSYKALSSGTFIEIKCSDVYCEINVSSKRLPHICYPSCILYCTFFIIVPSFALFDTNRFSYVFLQANFSKASQKMNLSMCNCPWEVVSTY